jgi:DNA-binding FrmR family transcriptional regulator
VSARTPPDIAAVRDCAKRFDAILGELRDVKQMMERQAAPAGEADAALDASVDSLRRLLSELLEQRTESVVRDLAGIRREAASIAERDGARIVERLDQLLESLGAARFDAEPMDVVDPLIHVVVQERHQADVPDGVILATLRPGYRTARGMVVSKAAVAVNRRV